MRGFASHIILSFALACGMCLSAHAAAGASLTAEEPDSVAIINDINNNTGVRIHQPQKLAERLNDSSSSASQDDSQQSSGKQARSSRSGYRVEVFADNNVRTAKVQAASKKRQLQRRFPQYSVYLVFESPFWRVRMGDFTNRAAAETAMEDVRRAFPALRSGIRVVRCNINN